MPPGKGHRLRNLCPAVAGQLQGVGVTKDGVQALGLLRAVDGDPQGRIRDSLYQGRRIQGGPSACSEVDRGPERH